MSVTFCKCGQPFFEHASDFMVREGHACRGDCQKVRKGGLLPQRVALPAQSGGNAKEGLEDILQGHLGLHRIEYVREYRWHPTRKWRSDFRIVGTRFLIECEGIVYQEGGFHQRPIRYANDCEKYNAATLAGWKVLRYTGKQIRSGEAINQIVEAVKEI